MKWWRRQTAVQKVTLVTLIVCAVGLSGSTLLHYPVWPFTIVGVSAVIVNGVMFVHRGMNAPVRGRPELSKPRHTPTPD